MNILIIGSTGMVGKDLIRLFKEDNSDVDITCCNSSDFVTKTRDLSKYQVIFNCANETVSKNIMEKLPKDTYYIDNSSYLRMKDYPLVVPEINMKQSQIYANPNCVTIILCLFLNAIKKLNPKDIEVSTYQSLSGAGKQKFLNFIDDTIYISNNLNNDSPRASEFKSNKLGFNFYPHKSKKDDDGFSGEENKVIRETKKIMDLDVFPTCIRVPAIRCHGETVTCSFEQNITKEDIIKILIANNITYQENPDALGMEQQKNIMVGHIRKSPFSNRWSFFVIGDQLTRGASYNAYKIFKRLI